jgi:mannosyltransferase
MAVMLAMGVWDLNRPGLYIGDAATLWAVRLPFPQLVRLLSHVDAVHATYYMLVRSVFFLGHSYVTARATAAVGAVLAVGLTSWWGLRLTGRRTVAVVGALLLALSTTTNQYAQDPRSYTIVMACGVGVSLALVRALERETAGRSRRRLQAWLPYLTLLVLCTYLHEMSAILLAIAQGVTLLWARVDRHIVLRWLSACAAAAMLSLPLLVLSATEQGAIGWIQRPGPASLWGLVAQFSSPVRWLAGLLVGLIVVGAVADRRRAVDLPAGLTPQRSLLPVLLLPSMLLLGESEVAQPLLQARYVLFCLPAGCLLAAIGADRVARVVGRSWFVRAAVVATLLVAVTAGQWQRQELLRTPDGRHWNLTQAAHYLLAHARSGEAIGYLPGHLQYVADLYPRVGRELHQFQIAVSPGRSGSFHGIMRHGRYLAEALERYRRVWVVREGGSDKHRQLITMLHSQHYRPVSDHAFHGGVIRLWVRIAHPRTAEHPE